MPLFSRSDGDLVRELPSIRRMMPYVMRGRNESAVYIPLRVDITKAKRWLWAYNRRRPDEPCTILHLALFLARSFLKEFPDVDRFVAGRRIWQRKVQSVSIVVKESLETSAPTFTIKIEMGPPTESLPEFSRRLADALRSAAELQRRTESDARRLLHLPDSIVRLALWGRDLLDAWNLLPHRWLRDDPLCTSLFVANLGSLGIPEAFHHLYETGTCSAFVVMGAVRRESVTDADGAVRVADMLPVFWTVDDRVADGFRAAEALRWYQARLEDPSRFLGTPEEAAGAAAPHDALTAAGAIPANTETIPS